MNLSEIAHITGIISAASLFFTHVCLTVRLGFPQIRVLRGIGKAFKGHGPARESLSALTVQLAATLGVGNIFGVALAVLTGGPGAIFWCWISGMLGIATAYAETLRTLKLGGENPGPWNGMGRWGRIYAGIAALAGLLIGAAIPAKSAVSMLPLPTIAGALIIASVTAVTVFGGLVRIRRLCEKLVPAAALLYGAVCVGLIISLRQSLPEAIREIFMGAFGLRQAAGGLAGGTFSAAAAMCAMREGVTRGLFSNEAGLGTAAIASAGLPQKDAERHALTCASGVFFDTGFFCALTGIAFSCAYCSGAFPMMDAAEFCREVFGILPGGEWFLRICTVILAFACIVGWNFIGTRAFSKAAGQLGNDSPVYSLLWTFAVFFGGILNPETAWNISDLLNTACLMINTYFLMKYYIKNR